jgi:acyl transferase domain-containing protein
LIFGHISILGVALTDRPLDSAGNPEEFWFNLKTNRVEFGKLAAARYRIGPFATEDEAKDALKLVAERSKSWDDEFGD